MDHHHDGDGHDHGLDFGTEGVVLYKIEAIFLTLIIALIGGLLPSRRQSSPALLSLGNCFSGGIFLSAAFLHMLQESVEGFERLPMKTHFPLAMFCTVLGILIPFFIEKVALGGNHDHSALLGSENNKDKKNDGFGIYVLWLMLGVHSIIEALALGISLVKTGVSPKRTFQLAVSFACSTPGGILLGWLLSHVLQGALNSLTTEIVKGIAAGTFIYVALAEILLEEFSPHASQQHNSKAADPDDIEAKSGPSKLDSATERYNKFFFVLSGIVTMSLFSMYAAH